MFKPLPRVVAIDDNPEHLKLIVQALQEAGWPCQGLHYDGGLSSPLLPLKGVRLVFLDIHLTPGAEAGAAASKAGLLADALRTAICDGPFAIIFWTAFPKDAQEMIDYLWDRERSPDVPLPLAWTYLEKTTVLLSAGTNLVDAVEKAIENIKILSPLLAWESRLQTAAAKALDGLAAMAMPISSPTGSTEQEYQKNLVGLLKKIAKVVSPEEMRAGQEWRAFEHGLLPLLEDYLFDDNASASATWNIINGMTGHTPENATSRLNSCFLVDDDVVGQTCTSRGVFSQLSLKERQWSRFFNQTKNFISKEFMDLKRGGGGQAVQAQRDVALSKAIWGVVEIGAACDHANCKNHMPRHVLALMLPDEYRKTVAYVRGHDRDKNAIYGLGNHEGCVEYGPFRYMEKDWHIALNFRYLRGFTTAEGRVLGEPVLRLRNQVVNEIGFKESAFHARPGIISFR